MKAFAARLLLVTAALVGATLFSGVSAYASSATISAGQGVILTATANGTAPFSYQWYKDGSAMAGAVSASYTIGNFQSSNAGTYSAIVANSAGSDATDDAVLSLAIANIAPAFTTQPGSQTVITGGSVTFTAAASGFPSPTYQWQKDGTAIIGATNASYSIASAGTGDAGSYAVVATNSAGTMTSNNASLTVNPAPSAPVFSTQPFSQTVTAGGSVTFTATASGVPTPTFQWQKGGVSISGATGSSYTISGVTAGDAGSYTMVATNASGSIASAAASLTVNPAPSAPIFSTQPFSQTVIAGGSVTFTGAASGIPSPTFQWQKGGVSIPGATNSSYTLSVVAMGDAGSYTLVATNSSGAVTSNSASLTVNPAPSAPVFTNQPASQTVTAGGSVTFTAGASGVPAPTYQWKKGGVSISGATGSSYTISAVVAGDAGSYTLEATNSSGAVNSNTASLTVNPAPSAPVFSTQPTSQTVTAGNAVTFTAAASGVPSPSYQWRKNSVNIIGATSGSYTISSTAVGDAGSYTMMATNSSGTVISSTATLTVNPAPSAPVISTQPASQTVGGGGSVTFTVTASGVPAPTYQWRKDGLNISGATGASYTATNLTLGSAGVYSVVVSNSSGSVTSFGAVLTINSSPAFTTQPLSQTVTVGGGVTFTAAATGTPAPTLQWKKGGTSIAGATNASYSITSVVTGSAGSYTVVATNAVGATTSATATLTVNPVFSAPVFTVQPASQQLIAGTSVTFTAVASGTPTPIYQWMKNNVNIIGATSANYTISFVTATDEASYTVVATNTQGAVTSNAASLSVIIPPSNALVSIKVN